MHRYNAFIYYASVYVNNFIGACLFACVYYLWCMVNEKALKTVANYARLRKCHRNWVYQLIKAEKVKTVQIDGVLFIDLKKTA